ncbi:MAG: NnrS family protein [Fibrobacteres bacterium]|nr:NnrS family protein [Fibrobacterota bacterium]
MMNTQAPAIPGTATTPALRRLFLADVDWSRQRSEPYRLLFPLGTLLAVVGIGVWIPYAIWPAAIGYPGQGHAVIQIQGFLMSFIFGLAGAPALAQGFHLALLANFLAFAIARFPQRKQQPPPPFVFIAAALGADVIGTVLNLGAALGFIGGPAFRAGALLQYQAFPLLLILGVGGFLLPKLFAQGPIDPRALAAGAPALRGQLALCLALLASYGVEIGGLFTEGTAGLRIAYAIRAAVFAWFMAKEIRIQKTPGKLPPYLRAARISLWVMAVGLIMPVIRPQYMLAWEHVIFLSGFMRLTLSIAIRVLASHAGRMEVMGMHARPVRIYGMLIVLSMMTRIATEIWPARHAFHLAIAAGLALFAIRMWARLFLPLVRVFPAR